MEPHDYYGSPGYESMQWRGWRDSAVFNGVLLAVGIKMLHSSEGVSGWLGLGMILVAVVRINADMVNIYKYKQSKTGSLW